MSMALSGPRKRAGLKLLGVGMLLALLSGCQSSQHALEALSSSHGRHVTVVTDSPYPLVYSPPRQGAGSLRLRVYIEGDGRAWATATQPSLDPSPRQLLVAQLAFNDPAPSVYLARPCQFISASGCQPEVWTDRRFSQAVVDSLDTALTMIKSQQGNSHFELVGYSGGAALALLLAAQRNDVTQVQTLAGNVMPAQWIQFHGLRPLASALEPLDYQNRLAQLPQRHFAGEDDRIVPTSLLRAYIKQLEGTCAEAVTLENVSHTQGWEQAWQQWQDQPIECLAMNSDQIVK
ncbi:alpha/beta hydrolase [Litchfieldella xinjiangensis]|uniref:alpha/beta hydrolase n=1 Tax=Litchfieldella xinjiangensis TaxID=1166948 RepID=UPI0006943789|nr:alpha/beta hydrolase [Halomonas xinjiangensis]